MNVRTIADHKLVLLALALAGAVGVLVFFFGPDVVGPLIFPLFAAGILYFLVRLAPGPLSRLIGRIGLSIRWKVLAAIGIIGLLLIFVSIVNIAAMNYMHDELHEIQDLRRINPSAVPSAVDDLESTQHGLLFLRQGHLRDLFP